jgi:translation initiation factor 2B subunit (eIF-2B alpha/beta/delta family)
MHTQKSLPVLAIYDSSVLFFLKNVDELFMGIFEAKLISIY